MFAAFSFGARPFDLQAAFDAWATTATEHPVPEFKGKPKRKDDPTAEAWLGLVEQGCTARRVPKAHWPAVATHFMAKKARGRVTEVEKVMRAMHGEQWAWTWNGFRVAVLNMGWSIDEKKTREVRVERKATGLWGITWGGNKDDSSSATPTPGTPAPKNSGGSKGAAAVVPTPNKKPLTDAKPNRPSKLPGTAPKPVVLPKNKPERTTTSDKAKEEKEKKNQEARPRPSRSNSLFSLPALPFLRPAAPQPGQSVLNRITAQVPLWLLAATDALAHLANENPDVLTAIATALVAVGTISGGGTAAVAAIGEAAVVVGRAIKTAHDRVQSSGGGHHRHG